MASKDKSKDISTEKKAIIDPKYKSYIYTGIFLVVVIIFFIMNNTNGEPEKGPYPPNYNVVPGKMLNLSDFKGKVVILDFWATWCPPCRKGIPDFIEIKNKYKNKDVEILGISIDEFTQNTKAQVVPFMKEYGINYPIVYGSINTTQMYGGIRSIPTSFVIDKDGNVMSSYVGLVAKENYINDIEKALSKNYVNDKKIQAPDFSLPLAK